MPLPIRASKLGRKSINGMAAFMEGGGIRGKIFPSLGIFVDTYIDIVPEQYAPPL